MAKTSNKYTIKGKVTTQSGKPVVGAEVKVMSGRKTIGKPVKTSVTGSYKLQITASELKKSGFVPGRTDLQIRVLSPEGKSMNSGLLPANLPTSLKRNFKVADEVIGEQNPTGKPGDEGPIGDGKPIDGEGPGQDGGGSTSFRGRVSGTVTDAAKRPMPEVSVVVVRRGLGKSQQLAIGTTGPDGKYDIKYAAKSAMMLSIAVEVYNRKKTLVYKSEVFHRPRKDLRLNILVEKALEGTSELAELTERLSHFVPEGNLSGLAQNEERDDLKFLSGAANLGEKSIRDASLSHRLSRESGLSPEFWFPLVDFGLPQETKPPTLDEQFSLIRSAAGRLDSATVEKKLRGAMRDNRISKLSDQELEGQLKKFEQFSLKVSLEDPSKNKANFNRKSFEGAEIKDETRQIRLAGIMRQNGGFNEKTVKALRKDKRFKKAEIESLRANFQLGSLTGNDARLSDAIRSSFKVKSLGDVSKLAELSTKDWNAFAQKYEGDGPFAMPEEIPDFKPQKDISQNGLGGFLQYQFKKNYPTRSFAGELNRSLKGDKTAGLKKGKQIANLLKKNPSIELAHTPLNELAKKEPALQRDEELLLELKAAQRLFKLNPDFKAVDTLMQDRIHSAAQVYRMGKSNFVAKYKSQPGFTEPLAVKTWNRAEETHLATVTIVAEIQSMESAGEFSGLAGSSDAFSTFPDYRSLFRTGDVCDCKHCRSAYSPAAYFADLLMFLKDRKAINPAVSLKDLLFARRPDLGWLELNCDNALVTLPYIDVVNEVLEAALADGANDLELVGLTAIDPDPEVAAAAIAAAFAAQDVEVSNDMHLTEVSGEWVVHTDAITWLLKLKSTPNYFAEILRNTKGKADELRAVPAYVNEAAYELLSAAKYPMQLPFDLFGSEVRESFKRARVPRWEVMEQLVGPSAPNNATEVEVAAEYFGIASDSSAPLDELSIILQTNVGGQFEYWGQGDNPAMIAQYENVKNFLLETGIEYGDLLQMLDLPWLNPGGAMAIEHLDATCDLDQKRIDGLDASAMDRFHRFLRMWRKTSLEIWELDWLIRHAAIGNDSLDTAFLVQLMWLMRLREKLGKKTDLEELLTLFGDINTETRFDGLHEPREEALYQNLFLNKRYVNPIDEAFKVENVLAFSETFTDHASVVLAGLRMRQSDLDVYLNLTRASDGAAYIPDELTLENLSFLYRHAWLAKKLKIKAEDWETLLKLANVDLPDFGNPAAVVQLMDTIAHVKESGVSWDMLNYVLTADPEADAAVKEETAGKFLASLRQSVQDIALSFDPAQYDFLQTTPPTDSDSLTGLLTELLAIMARPESDLNAIRGILTGINVVNTEVSGLPAAFDFPAVITDDIRISWDDATSTMTFIGLMTDPEFTTLTTSPDLAPVTGLLSYQEAIADMFWQPRLVFRFYGNLFQTTLDTLPESIDFEAQLPEELATILEYDEESQVLSASGILNADDVVLLNALSSDADYLLAIQELYLAPRSAAVDPAEIWLEAADLTLPLEEDSLPENLAVLCENSLNYLSINIREAEVVSQLSENLGLTPGMVAGIISTIELTPPETILAHFTDTFCPSETIVDYATHQETFDTWYWLFRLGQLVTAWKLELPDLEWLISYQGDTLILDIASLPLSSAQPPSPLFQFTRTQRLLDFRGRVKEEEVTLFELIGNAVDGVYASDVEFAEAVELMTDEKWESAEVSAFMNGVALPQPSDFADIGNLERLERAMYYCKKVDVSVPALLEFGMATMSQTNVEALREILRGRYGPDDWETFSTEIQDDLREKKRDALVAWHLSQPAPADAPSGKWENTNDVYAYYLLDVEMNACMLTSRMVQGSGSIQLFVQRCMMGLEPEVLVNDSGNDGDSAWGWWEWMRKYRVWEANRKVFLYPENWIEPELRRDKSSFFADLENTLMQGELNEFTIEDAFTRYLENLQEVSHLEVAGFFHEDAGDEAICHVFARSKAGEPRNYYYRKWDYRFWTPWEKVELEITGDNLVPAVINSRLYLFWPVFTEVPDDDANSQMRTPEADEDVILESVKKRLRIQLAVSSYRNGVWTPARTSTDYLESDYYTGTLVSKHLEIFTIDQSILWKDFAIRIEGTFVTTNPDPRGIEGDFIVYGCDGLPEKDTVPGEYIQIVKPDESTLRDLRHIEKGFRSDSPENDYSLQNQYISVFTQILDNIKVPLLLRTPNIFKVNLPWAMSYMDKLLQDFLVNNPFADIIESYSQVPVGGWLPHFYADKHRTFFALPVVDLTFGNSQELDEPENEFTVGFTSEVPEGLAGLRYYYPEVKAYFKEMSEFLEGIIRSAISGFDFSLLNPVQRAVLTVFLQDFLNTEGPFTDEQLRELVVRLFMMFANFVVGLFSLVTHNFRRYHFKTFYHPLVCSFLKEVYNPESGIPGLMRRETQMKENPFRFGLSYLPTPAVLDWPDTEDFPTEDVDFSPDGAYSSYNWELFYHAPLMIANKLSSDQQFEEAMNWYHYIFNPVGKEGILPDGSQADSPQKFWITKPFFLTTNEEYYQQRIDSIMHIIAGDTGISGYTAALKKSLEDQVYDWRNNPFEPHRIAMYRTVAYQKTVFMKYIDNLIAWGDNLFRQDSMESINEATQLYVLATELLGQRPQKVPPAAKVPVETFNELESSFDDFSNALIQVENLIPMMSGGGGGSLAPIPMLYFCIPQNEKLSAYYDTIEDRLYKIRNCMNIDGVKRSLSLFEPPIDPAALVKAVAGGLSIGAALADMNAPLPYYRFNTVLGRANALVSDLKTLASTLLSALEKKDAEALAMLRQGHEVRMSDMVKRINELKITEIEENLKALDKSMEVVEIKRDFYAQIEYLSDQESLQLKKMKRSNTLQEAAQGVTLAASVISLLPNIDLGASGFGGSPVAEFVIGGLNLGQASKLAADIMNFLSMMAANDATMAGIRGGHDRRWNDWKFQEEVARAEIAHIEQRKKVMEESLRVAEQELKNQELRMEQIEEVEGFMKSKYTNEELYQWMITQVSQVYFQTYQLAYDTAKQAERCYRFELGIDDSSFIEFGYWNSLKKGLMAGEKLQFDLRQLEAAYMEDHRREFELTKNVSLSNLNPLALVMLRETGQCFFSMPEEIFDLDFPGHYFRRIKTVTVSIPCVAGPTTTISATLRLLSNHIRTNTTLGDGYAHAQEDGVWLEDTRFVQQRTPISAIAASRGQQDSGMFQLNFEDSRYLPFEGAGAISDWKLELFNDDSEDFGKALRQFDYSTISDVVITVKYTAREDAGIFKSEAITHLRNFFANDEDLEASPATRIINLKQSFPTGWHKMINPADPADGNVLQFGLKPAHFPYRENGKQLKVNSLELFLRASEEDAYSVTLDPLFDAEDDLREFDLEQTEAYGNLHYSSQAPGLPITLAFPETQNWILTIESPSGVALTEDEITDGYLVLSYDWE